MLRTALIAGLLFCVEALPVFAQQVGEGYVIDPATGDYTFTYRDINTNEYKQFTYEPDKIEPFITSSFNLLDGGVIGYQYKINNGTAAKQDIPVFSLGLISNFITPVPVYRTLQEADMLNNPDYSRVMRKGAKGMDSPANWRSSISISHTEPGPGLNLAWGHRAPERNKTPGLKPGASQDGFGYRSYDLPGVLSVHFGGTGRGMRGYQPDTNGDAMSPETEVALHRVMAATDTFYRYAAAPKFEVPNPFNAVPLLEQIRDHVKAWPQQQLMEQTLWVQVDGLLASAISALKNGNTLSAEVSLTQLRVELRRKYPDLDVTTSQDDPKPSETPSDPAAQKAFLGVHDQRLAAKILDFNTGFVLHKLIAGAPQNLDTPAPLMPPVTNTMYAPPADLDGSFTVSWSTPLIVYWIGSATRSAVAFYDLEYSKNGDFSGSTKIKVDRKNLSQRLQNLAPGRYYIRVLAWIGEGDNCQNCIGGSEPYEVYSPYHSVTYNGPNRTEVLSKP